MNVKIKKMKKTKSLFTLFLLTSLMFVSCSDDDSVQQETLTVQGTFEGELYEKMFTVNSDDVLTDTEGFEFELDWTSQEGNDFDLDFYTDAQTSGGDFNTGFDLYFSRAIVQPEIVQILNTDNDTYGSTLINLYDSFDDLVSYTLKVKRISNGEVVKTITNDIQSTIQSVDNQYLIGGQHFDDVSHGFEVLGEFIKVDDKFYFSY